MIDFSTLKSLTIPEGEVVKIADASGNVLWEKAPEGATITLTTSAGFEKVITIGGQSYSGDAVITVPIGTVVELRGFNQVNLYANGTVQTVDGNYDYTVIGNVAIHLSGTKPVPTYTVYVATITEP